MERNVFKDYASNENNADWERHIERQAPLYKRKDDIRSEYERDYTRICQKQPRRRTGVCIHTGKREITARFTTPNKMLCIPPEKVLVASVACIGIFSPYRHDGLLKSP